MARAKPPAPTRRRRAATKQAEPQTCGDLGGVGADGQPCSHAAGWGTEAPGSGLCSEHNETAVATMQAHKKRFLELLSSGEVSLRRACQEINRDPATIYRWRRVDAEFDSQVSAAQDASDTIRVGLVEDSVFARIIAGKASPAETIFFLKNRAPERWRDRQEVTGANGAPIGVAHTIMFGDQEITF